MLRAGAPAADMGSDRVGPTLLIYGTEEQKAQFLPAIRNGDVTWCQGFSEPGAGSDLASLQTRAVLAGDDFVLNGSKIWTSNAHHADWMFVLARTDPEAPKHRGISYFLLDMRTPGITVRPLINLANEHGFNQIFFEDVRISRRYLVGELNRGWYVATTTLDFERSGIQRLAGGARTLEMVTAYASELATAGRLPLWARHGLAELHLEYQTGRLLSYRVAWMQSRGLVPNYEASISKTFGTEWQQRLAAFGVKLLGLYGQLAPGSLRAPLQGALERAYLSSVSATIAAGTSEVNRNIIATRGLGLPR
jgi:alkylation response protein AidB-like acyl-CoA dehydrogenase